MNVPKTEGISDRRSIGSTVYLAANNRADNPTASRAGQASARLAEQILERLPAQPEEAGREKRDDPAMRVQVI